MAREVLTRIADTPWQTVASLELGDARSLSLSFS